MFLVEYFKISRIDEEVLIRMEKHQIRSQEASGSSIELLASVVGDYQQQHCMRDSLIRAFQ